MIKTIKGNILETKAPIIAHQVNCKGVMGAGVARAIKNKYPEVYWDYKKYSPKELGQIQPVQAGLFGEKIVVNLFAQEGYGKDKRYTDYEALKACFLKLKEYTEEVFTKKPTIAMPYGIGCGLAGGDWEKVYPMIEEVFAEFDIELWQLE